MLGDGLNLFFGQVAQFHAIFISQHGFSPLLNCSTVSNSPQASCWMQPAFPLLTQLQG